MSETTVNVAEIKSNFFKQYFKEIMVSVIFLLAYVPTFIWMWERWFARDSYYSHGILVPVLFRDIQLSPDNKLFVIPLYAIYKLYMRLFISIWAKIESDLGHYLDCSYMPLIYKFVVVIVVVL